MRARATVFYMPETVIEAKWAADNGQETAVFTTQDEAIDFAWKRWRIPREQIQIGKDDKPVACRNYWGDRLDGTRRYCIYTWPHEGQECVFPIERSYLVERTV